MSTFKEKATNVAIKTTSIVFGTGYVVARTFAEGCKSLEAKIICKLDNNYSELEVKAYRTKSYHVVHQLIDDKLEQARRSAEDISRKINKKSYANQASMMGQDEMVC